MAETTEAVASLPPTRRSILRSKSTSDVSTTSTESKQSACITFAPLPEIAARKRRNTRPLGMASRAEMLRKSRRQFDAPMYEDHAPPPPDDEEIPLPDLGKLVKGLWRSVSRKDKGARTTTVAVAADMNEGVVSSAIDQEHPEGDGSVWVEQVDWASQDTSAPPLPITRNTNRDTLCAIDNAPFLDQYDEKTHVPRRMEDGLANG